jgi:dTDP-4-amino-4,6-dideoxygalactose transaminase
VIDSGWYVLGKELEAFEALWARRCGLAHGVGVGNGMDAIEIGLRALDIGPGDEVITTPMTAFATVLAILRTGAAAVLADIDPRTALLDPESVRRCLSPRTRALVLVHLYGQVRRLDVWHGLCQDVGIHLVEDCAQVHLATTPDGRVAGSVGIFGAYSFYPTKNLGALGDGGMLVCADHGLAARARQLRNYGQSERYYHPILGLNSRLDEMQAALLAVKDAWLDAFTERRRAVAQRLLAQLSTPYVHALAAPEHPEAHAYHLLCVITEHRQALQAHLGEQGVQALIHYPVPVHHQLPCTDLAHDPLGLVHAERHAQQCLSLPCHPQLSDIEVDHIAAAVNRFAPAQARPTRHEQ